MQRGALPRLAFGDSAGPCCTAACLYRSKLILHGPRFVAITRILARSLGTATKEAVGKTTKNNLRCITASSKPAATLSYRMTPLNLEKPRKSQHQVSGSAQQHAPEGHAHGARGGDWAIKPLDPHEVGAVGTAPAPRF